MGFKTGGPISVHTSNSSKKSRYLWTVMMDDNAPTHERRTLVKTYKNVLPRIQIVVAEVCREIPK